MPLARERPSADVQPLIVIEPRLCLSQQNHARLGMRSTRVRNKQTYLCRFAGGHSVQRLQSTLASQFPCIGLKMLIVFFLQHPENRYGPWQWDAATSR